MDFVASPYFNKNDKTLRLLHYLLRTNSPTFAEATKKLTNETPPTKKYILNLMSKLVKLYDCFLAIEKLTSKPFELKLAVIESYDELNRASWFEKNWTKLLVNCENEMVQDAQQMHKIYRIHRLMGHSFTRSDVRQNDENLQVLGNSLDVYYIAEKLRITCEMLNRKNIVNTPYDIAFVESVIHEIDKNRERYLDFPVINIYYLIYKTFMDESNESHYTDLKVALQKHYHQFNKDEAREMYVFAQNYCIKKINQGSKNYYDEIFQLYKQLLENGVILVDDELSEWDYKNIVTTGTRLRQYKWVLQFIEDYRLKLNKSIRKNAHQYNLANFYYSVKDYDKAISLLSMTDFTDVYYALGARSILLKSYYEQNELEAFQSLVQSFKIYLRRNKTISKYQYQTHLNLVKLLDKLFRLKYRSPTMRTKTKLRELDKIKKTITEYDIISNKIWLLDQVHQFEKSI